MRPARGAGTTTGPGDPTGARTPDMRAGAGRPGAGVRAKRVRAAESPTEPRRERPSGPTPEVSGATGDAPIGVRRRPPRGGRTVPPARGRALADAQAAHDRAPAV